MGLEDVNTMCDSDNSAINTQSISFSTVLLSVQASIVEGIILQTSYRSVTPEVLTSGVDEHARDVVNHVFPVFASVSACSCTETNREMHLLYSLTTPH